MYVVRRVKRNNNEASALRLVTAVLMEISEDWETNKTYLNMETL